VEASSRLVGFFAVAYQVTANNLTVTTTGSAQNDFVSLQNLALDGTISGTVAGGARLVGSFTLGAFSVTSGNAGFAAVNSKNMTVLMPTLSAGVTGDIEFKVTTPSGVAVKNTLTMSNDIAITNGSTLVLNSSGDLLISNNITSNGTVVLWSHAGNMTTASGKKITVNGAGKYLALNPSRIVNLNTNVEQIYLNSVGGLGGSFTITNDRGFGFATNVEVGNHAVSLTATTGGITLPGGKFLRAKSLALTAGGAVDFGNIDLTDTTTTPGTTIYGAVTGTVAGAISLTGIMGGSLSGLSQTADGTVTIHSTMAKNFSSMVTRSASVVGDVTISVSGAGNVLTLSGAINAGAKKITLNGAGGIVINDNLTSTGTINLTSGGGISTGNIGATTTKAIITAGTLTGSAAGAVNINTDFDNWGDFTNSSVSGTTVTNNGNLSITGTVDITGDLTLTQTGTVSTSATGQLTASSLFGSASGAVTLSKASITNVYFDLTNNSAFTLTSDKAVAMGAMSAAGSAVSITSSTGAIVFLGAVTTGALTLNAKQGITVSGGSIIASSLSATAQGGGAVLTGLTIGTTTVANVFTPGAITGTVAGAVTLSGSFGTATGLTQTKNGTVTFTSAQSLTTLAAITRSSGVTGDIIYKVSGAGNTITLDRDYNLGSDSITLQSDTALVINKNLTTTGTITLKSNAGISTADAVPAAGGNAAVPAVLITANKITGTAGGTVNLNTDITNLYAFTVSNGGNLTLSNAGALVVNGAVALSGGTPGTLTLTVTGANKGITTSDAGSITAGSLALTSTAAVSLTGLNLSGAITGTVAGAVTLGGAYGSVSGLTQTVNGTMTLSSTSSRVFSSLVTRATGITGEVMITVTGAGNNLTIGGALNSGANKITLNSAGGIVINDNITTTGIINLVAGAGIATGNIGATTTKALITANSLTGSAASVVDINTAIANWGDFTNSGTTTLTNSGNLSITGNVNLTAGIAFKQTGTISTIGTGKLTATALSGNSSGNVTLSNASLSYILGFTVTNNSSFSLTNNKLISITGTNAGLTATGGEVSITTSSDGIYIDGRLNVGALTLSSKAEITSTAAATITASSISATAQGGGVDLRGLNVGTTVSGTFTPGTVSGTAAGAVTLNGTFGLGAWTQTASGYFSVTNTNSMVITKPTRGAGITGGYFYKVTGTGTLTLAANTDFGDLGGGSIDLVSDGNLNLGHDLKVSSNAFAINIVSLSGSLTINNAISGAEQISLRGTTINGTGKVTGDRFQIYATDDVDIKSNVNVLGRTVVKNNKSLKITNDKALTVGAAIDGDRDASNNVVAVKKVELVTLSGGITANTATITATDMVVTSAGAASLGSLNVTGALTGTVAGDITLTNIGGVNFSGLQQTANGKFSFISNTSVTSLVAPNRAINAATSKAYTGEVYYEVTGAATMTFSAAADFGANNVTLKSNQSLTINQNITTTGKLHLEAYSINTVNIGATTTKAKIGAGTLTVQASNPVDLNMSIDNLGYFSLVSPLTSYSVTLANDKALNISGQVNNARGTITLNVAGAISYSVASGLTPAGQIAATTLTGSATGAVNLNTSISNLGAFTVSDGKDFILRNDKALAVTGAVALSNATVGGTVGNVGLTTTGGDLAISTAAGAIGSISSKNLTATSAGTLDLSGLALTGTLTADAGGEVKISGAIGTLGTITQIKAADSTTTNFDFTLNGTSSLTISSLPLRRGGAAGAVNYTLTGASSVLTIGGNVDFGANNANLTAQGGFALNGGVSTSGTLSLTSSGGGITQNATTRLKANTLNISAAGAVEIYTTIENLGAVTITGNNNFTLNNIGGITLTKAVMVSGGAVKLTSTI
ncbi:MAG: hypothetical protein ORN98_09355, partial [Alphaproteobacteria bacterium]|nr:hypothetical protein [Alphaproteobacteria bacterium]